MLLVTGSYEVLEGRHVIGYRQLLSACLSSLSAIQGTDTFSQNESSVQGADKSLARPTSRYILFDGENISFDTSLVIYIYIYIYIYL